MSANLDRLEINSRTMVPEDIDQIVAIEQRNYPFPWKEGVFRDCLRVGYRGLVLCHAQRLTGYGIVQIAADEAHLLNLCIDRPWQYHGLARRLLGELLELASSAGAHTMFLEARPSVPRAIALYHASGFNEIGLRRNYYETAGGREDAIVMARAVLPVEPESS